jgi:tRNA 2-selenouridine synthase
MARYDTLSQLDAQSLARFDMIIDARSPAEFAEDHLPGAMNLPVLDDDQRAEVGTLYAQVSPFEARRKGAALVARNVAAHLETALADQPRSFKPLVYCWRGGMRSNSFAIILASVGWRASVVEGGYRTWRRTVIEGIEHVASGLNLIVVDGQTGSGKTALLHRLAERGEQVIDLEGLAVHRGSAFGAEPERDQPSQKAFETGLWSVMADLDVLRPVFIEAESALIGRCRIPAPLWEAMKAAPRVEVRVPAAARAVHTLETYPDMVADAERIEDALDRLIPLHGKAKIAEWRALAAAEDFRAFAEALIIEHYDPAYTRARKRQAEGPAAVIQAKRLDGAGLDRLADQLVKAAHGLAPR